jgi:hypothetical protein
MAAEDTDDTDVEQIAGQTHASRGKQLTGCACPTVLFAVETYPTANHEYAKADIGINAKKQMIPAKKIFVHFIPP